MELASCYCLHDDAWFLPTSIQAVKEFGPVVCFVSKRGWDGSEGEYERCVKAVEGSGAELILGDWPDESMHRRFALAEMKRRGHKHILIPDGDEVAERRLLESILRLVQSGEADLIRVHMSTYWKDAAHIIRPAEKLAPLLMVNAQIAEHEHIREYKNSKLLTLGPEYGVLHHLSYAGPDERIQRKISTWGHRHEVGQEWYRTIWKGWELDPLIRDLHPTHPHCYHEIERIDPVPELADLPRWRKEDVEVPEDWPKVSIVIPVHGCAEELKQCLDSLNQFKDLIHEVIVVDDASDDFITINSGPSKAASSAKRRQNKRLVAPLEGTPLGKGFVRPEPSESSAGGKSTTKLSQAVQVAKGYPFVTLLQNETNLGFAATCNKGIKASTGQVILFLNSDTIVPRAGFIRLIEGLMETGTVGAAGPMSNNVGYYQRITPTYQTLDTLDYFAEDLALSAREDQDVEMLVGFALAVRRSVLGQVGFFDERFKRGMFEDTDLCYRIARAGYRLKMVGRAYIHHWGSRTIQRVVPDISALMSHNGRLYQEKWKHDLETGYASHLPGLNVSQGLVKFNPQREPKRVAKQIARMRDEAKITLCMIVKNEERVLDACLESAKPFFHKIVIIDTGSTDRTIEIAKSHGAEVHEMEWPMSFSVARNESLKYSDGIWTFWMDADDVMPWATGEAVLHTALNAAKGYAGYIVPVQFVEGDIGEGTRVDHVKLFRNKPDIHFVGRIHEQNLESIRRHGEIGRIKDVCILHAGYDTSSEGQRKKRERDWPLLLLDFEERPDHPFPRFNIGMTHHYTVGGHEEAVEWLKKSIEVSGPHDSTLRKAWSMMGVSLRELGKLDEAEQAFRDGLNQVGTDPELSFQLAMTLVAKGRFAEACELYESMSTEIEDHFSSVDIGILTFKRLHNLAAARMSMGDYPRARAAWLAAIEKNPRFMTGMVALTEAAFAAGDFRTARHTLEGWMHVGGAGIEWAEQRARLADECGEHGGGLGVMSQLAYEIPQAIGPRLWLSRQLLAMNQVDAATPHLQILEQQDVAEAAFFLGVSSLQRGDITGALAHTERAVQLNPAHAQSVSQLERLRAALDVPIPSVLTPEKQRKLLIGPHVGELGEATKRYSVVIVTYNSEVWIPGCLASVLPMIGALDEVIVVDNASSDHTVEFVSGLGDPRITIISNAENIGYAPAANVGLLASSGKFLVLMNPDTEAKPGALDCMAAALDSGVGAVGPLSDNVAGAQFVGHYISSGMIASGAAADSVASGVAADSVASGVAADSVASGAAADSKVGAMGEARVSAALEQLTGRTVATKMLMGLCIMVPRSVLDQVGLLDDNLVLGADDLEFSWRLRMLGLTLRIAMDAFVHHHGQKSFETRERSETSALVKQSDAVLLGKLRTFYGKNLPTSLQLWNCPIFDEAMAG